MSRYIDAEWLRSLYADFKDYGGRTDWETPVANVLATIDDAPTIDIVRCKECKFIRIYEDETSFYYCALEDRPNRQWSVDETDYCSWGERKESE